MVFTSLPTNRFIGDADEKLLLELVRSHPELTCVAFQNVTISKRFFLVGAGLWQLLNSVILIDAKILIIATFKHGREFIWEINVDNAKIETDGSDVGLVYSLRRVVRGLIRQHFLDHKELYMKWLRVVLPLLDKEYFNDRKAVLHLLHDIRGHQHPYLSINDVEIVEMDFSELPAKYTAMMIMYIQSFGCAAIARPQIRMPGVMF